MLQWQPYTLAPLTGVVVAIVVGVLAWRRRASIPAATALGVVMAGLLCWATEDAIASVCTDLEVKTTLALTRFPATGAVVLGFCWLCRSMSDHDARLPRWLVRAAFVEPVLITVAAATNGWHQLVLADTEVVGRPGLLLLHQGPLYYLHSLYSYALMTWAVLGVARAWRSTSALHRRQLTTVLLAAVFPVIGNIVTLVRSATGGGGDFAVLGFVVAAAIAPWAVFRQGLLQLVPVARGLVLERVSDAVVVVDVAGRVLDLNPAAIRLIRRVRPDLPAELLGLPDHELLGGADGGQQLVDGECSFEVAGEVIDLDVRSSALSDRRGAPIGRVVVARDVTELNRGKRALQAAVAERDALGVALRHQAYHDTLTGLANRALFADRLTEEYARAHRHGLAVVAMLIDLDDFKPVNDRLGHHAGDLVLREVAARLRRSLGELDTVARLGGDEFAALLCRPRHDAVAAVAERVADALHQPYLAAGHELRIGASIGVAVDVDASADPELLLRDADAAMYRVKRERKRADGMHERHPAAPGYLDVERRSAVSPADEAPLGHVALR